MIRRIWRGSGLFICLLFGLVICSDPPVPDDCQSRPFENGLELDCSLSAINSADEKTNFSVLPSEHTLSLRVKCRDPTLSQLEANGLSSLQHLKKLTLDGCHLRSIPARAFWGLNNLVSLTVATRNAGVLAVEPMAFAGLDSLEILDLSGNYIRHLAPGVLCSLPKLSVLNLSRNEIGSISDLGLEQPRGCQMAGLQTLDMSYNALNGITEKQLEAWPRLASLRLSNNFLRSVEREAFTTASSSLKEVDVSNNQFSSLNKNLFEAVTGLQTLVLANNTLTELPDSIFDAVAASLLRLDLSGNFLTSISSRLVSRLSSLNSLDLSHNEIEAVHAQAFSGLKSLNHLRLDGNRISKLSKNLFKASEAVQTLILSDNALSRLGGQVFANLASLSHLLLDKNLLEDLPSSLFDNTSSLSVLDLSHNRFSAIPEAANSPALHNLQSLSMSGNTIGDLGSLKMPSLWRLQASDNRLVNLTSSNLNGLTSLQVLDLSNNKINFIEKGMFGGRNLPIKALRLDANNLERMDGLFQDLADLSWLNVSANSISVFDYAMLPRGLTWLDLHQNAIASLGNYFSLEGEFSRLAHIDASFNRIAELGPQNVPNHVETLLLNDNQIKTLVPYTFFKKTNLKKADLTVNQIESIDRNALRLAPDVIVSPEFLFGGNPIKCDCLMAWFKTINQMEATPVASEAASGAAVALQQNFPRVADLESIYCQLLYSRDKSFVPLVEAATDDFLCTYKTHCFALCHCCEYDACDCEMTCPDNCTCYHDNSWSKNIAECSGSDFHDLPDQLPMDATEIFLDGNNVGELRSHTFIGRKNLKALYLNHSLISSVQNHTFNGLVSLQVLHLEGNSIKELQGDEFHGLRALRELYLQNNLIRAVNNVTFRDLENLEILHIHGNRLIDFPVWQLSFNSRLASIRLADNTWSCECQFVENFHNWLVKHATNVPDSSGVACVLDPNEPNSREAASASALVKTTSDDQQERFNSHLRLLVRSNISTCQEASATTHVQEKIVRDYLPLLGATLAAFALLAVIVILMFVYRNEVRVWLHSKYGVRFFQRIDDFEADKIFDAFLSYSAKDDAFVRQVLAPELEHGLSSQQYKLCLFYRDLPIQAYLADTIVQANEASRRTILILSENFLKSEWSRYDYKSGLHQALRSGRTKLIVIVLGEVANRDIDPDLRLYLKTSIVLYWGDRHFWEKLKYSLPDVKQKSHGVNSFCHGYNSMQLMNSSESDTNSFRYETCPRRPVVLPVTTSVDHSIYNTVGSTSTEQESTRTMTIHI